MKVNMIHGFLLTQPEMIMLQNALASRVEQTRLHSPPRLIAGFDVSYSGSTGLGVACIFEYPSLELIETYHATAEADFGYVPGLLAFREIPAFVKTVEEIPEKHAPDIFVFDANGIMHPRGLGFASHASFFVDRPTFGIAKTRLLGMYSEPGNEPGDYSYVRFKKNIVGAALRTVKDEKPVFVSVGNRITLDECIELTKRALDGNRIPRYTRIPDQAGKRLKAEVFKK